MPPVPADNFAYFRRWILLEFPNKFEGDDRDKDIASKITTSEEKSGLLNVVIGSLKNILKNGDYTTTQTVQDVERMYRINSDPIAAFASECVVYSVDDCDKMVMYEHYTEWCKDNCIEPKTSPKFSARFGKLGYNYYRSSTGNPRPYMWESCSIVESVQDSGKVLDVKKQEQGTYPSNCPAKKDHCSNIDKKNNGDNKNNILLYADNGTKTPKPWTDLPKTSQPMIKKSVQGLKDGLDGSRTDVIDMNHQIKIITSFKNSMHPDGRIPEYGLFALIVYNQSKELKGVVTVKQIEQLTRKLAKDGWKL